MADLSYPLLYQINTRVWLTELSQKLDRPAALDDIRDTELDRIAELGFDWVWLLSMWQTGLAGQRISKNRKMEIFRSQTSHQTRIKRYSPLADE